MDEYDYPHISYFDWSNDDLKYAYWDGEGWQLERVDSQWPVGRYTSLALDPAGYPHISYRDGSDSVLRSPHPMDGLITLARLAAFATFASSRSCL